MKCDTWLLIKGNVIDGLATVCLRLWFEFVRFLEDLENEGSSCSSALKRFFFVSPGLESH